ncbi:hypothetical protein NADE_008925 [Nannochloris sp. 'desiccata']|nr:hypothetical protein NADE_008925 [Chlorella desiccata (nom. nud.)]
MYTPLPAREGGPVTRNPLAAPLRGTLRVFNAALAVVSLSLLASTLYMYIVYHRTGLLPPAPTPSETFKHLKLMEPAPPPASIDDGNTLWFLWLVGSFGAIFLAVASSGMVGLQPENRQRLFMHIILLTGLILTEVAVLIVLFTDDPWREKIPEDLTGFWPLVENCIDKNTRVVKLAALAAIGAQLAGLGASCWLHSMYQSAYEDWIDGVEAEETRVQQELGRAAEQAYAGSGPSSWQSRIRGKYGLNSKEWEATALAAAAVQQEGLVDEGRRRSGLPEIGTP